MRKSPSKSSLPKKKASPAGTANVSDADSNLSPLKGLPKRKRGHPKAAGWVQAVSYKPITPDGCYRYPVITEINPKTLMPQKIKERVVKDKFVRPSPEQVRDQQVTIMMRRLFSGGEKYTNKKAAKDLKVSERTIEDRAKGARADGVPEVARKIFISEFLPVSMARLKEALLGDDLKLAVQVALKMVDGLKVMEDPATFQPASLENAEPESLEAWRVKFKDKGEAAITVESNEVKQLGEHSD